MRIHEPLYIWIFDDNPSALQLWYKYVGSYIILAKNESIPEM